MYETCRCLTLAAVLGLASLARAADTPLPPPHVETFQSGGRTIHVEVYEPTAPGLHRTILVLHGAGGMPGDGAAMRAAARRLTQDHARVYLAHYFDRSDLWLTADDGVLINHFDTWQATVRDAVAWVYDREKTADPRTPPRLGIFGYSMGAFTGLAASSDNPRVRAVVAQSGGAWLNRFDRYDRLPPLLILHGLRDGRVPFRLYIPPLLRWLHRSHAVVETRFFPREGHLFHRAALAEVRELAADFFARRLPLPAKKRRSRQENPAARRRRERILSAH